MAKRRFHSLKTELLKKSREAMLAAVQLYNNPQITFKTESFITLAIIGWTYLMHAYYRSQGIDYRYCEYKGKQKRIQKTAYGAAKLWGLERCLNDDKCPLDNETVMNLRFLIGIRHEIEHQMTDKIDEYLSAKLQACAINYDFYITELFGSSYSISDELALAIQFSPLTPEQRGQLKANPHLTTNVRNFIVDFEAQLPEETLRSSKYAYRVLYVPINAHRRGQADKVVEFIKEDSPLAEDAEKQYVMLKETEKNKYLPSEVVKLMQDRGYIHFKMKNHIDYWKMKNAKNNSKYGTMVSKTWYWYDSWVEEVELYCREHSEEYK